MATLSQRQVTQLLLDWREGDQEAVNRLIPLVHQELKRLARHYMRRERAGHTLQTSALVNEAYNFGGLEIEETAHVIKVSPGTVKRECAAARLWIHREINKSATMGA